ncbi:MAG: dephospho-CoA kinase [Verrucomicrobia bacterium GWC2_42_7]|nr:MAG: dephospho-CoA kinase [Verrucomicrobia bacterium GWC2_42_7]
MIIGLTGTIGCGKTTGTRFFEETGSKIISSDAIAHELMRTDKGIRGVLEGRWGRGIFDDEGRVFRRKIASIVFNDGQELDWLEGLLHPRIHEERERLMQLYKGQFVVVEVPLLFEKKLENICDYVVCIYTSSKVRNERLNAKGYSLLQIEARLKRQLPLQEKIKKSHFVITNDGSFDFLKQQILYLIKKLYG